jgi:hypothetical protein
LDDFEFPVSPCGAKDFRRAIFLARDSRWEK